MILMKETITRPGYPPPRLGLGSGMGPMLGNDVRILASSSPAKCPDKNQA